MINSEEGSENLEYWQDPKNTEMYRAWSQDAKHISDTAINILNNFGSEPESLEQEQEGVKDILIRLGGLKIMVANLEQRLQNRE